MNQDLSSEHIPTKVVPLWSGSETQISKDGNSASHEFHCVNVEVSVGDFQVYSTCLIEVKKFGNVARGTLTKQR